jgi:succinoglycan biosynthesis protein ExoL
MKIVYFAQDLADPAVHRRVRMLRKGCSDIVLLGFRRSAEPIDSIEGVTPIDLGQTEARKLRRRVGSVVTAMIGLHRHRHAIAGATAVLGRNLDMLLLASLARRRYAPSASLVYECLDIHWAMVSRSPLGAALRWIEGMMLRSCDLLVVSAPDFITGYFNQVHGQVPPGYLLENKVLESELATEIAPVQPRPAGTPWRIGWFAAIRCQQSLHLLADLTRRMPGKVQVVIQGNVVWDNVPDFMQVIESTPGLEYRGTYDRRTDLPVLYSDVHFAWTVDFFGRYGNSDKLLPNRLYEAGLYGCVPIAERSVATGRWLENHNAGILLDDPIEESTVRFFETLDADTYAQASKALSLVPRSAFLCSDDECRSVCSALAGLPTGSIRPRWRVSEASGDQVKRGA